MADEPRLHLRARHRRLLEKLLREHLPDVEAWAYGSRVNGRSHDGSDLDLVLRGPGLDAIPIGRLVDFEEAVRESSIPILWWRRGTGRGCRSGFRGRSSGGMWWCGEAGCRMRVWREVAIDDVATVIGGGTPSTKNANNFGGSIPWLTPRDLSGAHDRYVERGARNLSQQGLDSSSARLLPKGAVLLLTRATRSS